ncbi:MAG: hypothetical protein ABFC85_11560 [Rectinema sp.]
MSDDPTKKRMARAKRRAHDDLLSLGYQVIPSDNQPVCLVAYRGGEVRLIRICLDEATAADRKTLGRVSASSAVSRELWVRARGVERFSIIRL